MSVMRPLLNRWLRLTEKPHLRKANVQKARGSFEAKSKFLFHAPRGTSVAESEIGDVPALWTWALGVGREDGPLILYFHGGGFVFGSPRVYRKMLAVLSKKARAPAALVQYRLAPETPFPGAFDDCMAAYRAVMDRPGGVVLAGDSAGGCLALAVLAEITREGLTPPKGCIALSPVTDLTFSGDSIRENAESEVVLPIERAEEMCEWYLGGTDPKDPRVSPLFAGFEGASPVWIGVGDTEVLRDDTIRMAAHLRKAGVEVTEVVAHDLPHVWPLFHNLLPEGRETLADLGDWIRSLSSS